MLSICGFIVTLSHWISHFWFVSIIIVNTKDYLFPAFRLLLKKSFSTDSTDSINHLMIPSKSSQPRGEKQWSKLSHPSSIIHRETYRATGQDISSSLPIFTPPFSTFSLPLSFPVCLSHPVSVFLSVLISGSK